MKATEQLITPQKAEQLLRGNTNNRNLSKRYVERLVDVMKADQWKPNGESIKMSADGRLLDGQHRLTAIVQSGCAQKMLIVEGLDGGAMDTIDIGKHRTFGDWLNMQGEEHFNLLAASLHKLKMYKKHYVQGEYINSSKRNNKSAYQELEKLLKDNPNLRLSVEKVANLEARKLFDRSTLALMHFLFSIENQEKSDEFMSRLSSGANLSENHPILMLRNAAIRWKSNSIRVELYEIMAYFIKAWNAFVVGKDVQFLRFNAVETFPEILGGDYIKDAKKHEGVVRASRRKKK